MDRKQLIEKIKLQLKQAIAPVKFNEVKSGDMIITYDGEEIVVGLEVFTPDQDGNNVPLPDGEYTLDTGVVIAVMNGKVEAIVNAEVVETPETPVEETPIVEEQKEELAEVEVNTIESLMERIVALEAKVESLLTEKVEMSKKIEMVMKQPSNESIKVQPTETKTIEDKTSQIDIVSLRERIRKNYSKNTNKKLFT